MARGRVIRWFDRFGYIADDAFGGEASHDKNVAFQDRFLLCDPDEISFGSRVEFEYGPNVGKLTAINVRPLPMPEATGRIAVLKRNTRGDLFGFIREDDVEQRDSYFDARVVIGNIESFAKDDHVRFRRDLDSIPGKNLAHRVERLSRGTTNGE
jgi:cold shock CspA family protein